METFTHVFAYLICQLETQTMSHNINFYCGNFLAIFEFQ